MYYIHYPLSPGREKVAWNNITISFRVGEVDTLRPERWNGQNALILVRNGMRKKRSEGLMENTSEISLPKLIDIV